ncbi:MAG: acyloxyacyl hydrolase [Pseudomonadota bacterium]
MPSAFTLIRSAIATAAFVAAAEALATDSASADRRKLDTFIVGANGDEGDLVAAHVGLEYTAAPRLGITVAPQLSVSRAQNTQDDTVAIVAADIQLRWYGLRAGRLASFIEAGAGAQYTGQRSFPASGTHFNFRLRAGLGARVAVTPRWEVLSGYNWLHMSNGNALTPNVGHDGPMYFIGATYSLGAQARH